LKNKVIRQETGELLFTHYGISGPIVLDLSRLIMDYRHRQGSSLMIDFFPGYRAEGLAGFLSERWQAHPQKTLSHSLLGLLPQKLCSVLVGELNLPGETRVGQISRKDLQRFAERLTGWELSVKGPRPFTESMVTAGGVKMDEVNIKTMESLKGKGLYLSGEILDIDGVSGGYNLQFAWSTGAVAGMHQ
jgi:predicted Rossmann fold flavoprotein